MSSRPADRRRGTGPWQVDTGLSTRSWPTSPIRSAMRTSAFRRAGGVCRGRIGKLALVNLEGVEVTFRRAGWRWTVGGYGYPGSSRNDPVGAGVERCSAGAPADRDEDLLQALSPNLARTVPLLQVVPVRVNQEPGARAGLARTVSCPSASSRNVFPVGNAALAGRMCCFSGHFGDSQVGQGPPSSSLWRWRPRPPPAPAPGPPAAALVHDQPPGPAGQ